MTAVQTATIPPRRPVPATARLPIALLRALLLAESAGGLVLTIFLSMLAVSLREVLGGDAGRAAEEGARFAAAAAFIFAILAAIASRGARRRRSWAWTLAALLQLVLAIATGVAVLTVTWHPLFLLGLGLPPLVMLVLSTPSLRRALDQE